MKELLRRALYVLILVVVLATQSVSAISKDDVDCANSGGSGGTCFSRPSDCGPGGEAASPSPDDASSSASITGDIQSLAKQVLSDSNISFDYGPSGPTGTQFKRLADGQKAQTDNKRDVDVQPIVLVTILHMAQNHKVNVSALTDGSSHTAPTNPHGAGTAADINIFDGSHTNGSDAVAQKIIASAAEVLPNGSRFGMGNAPFGTKQIDGKTFGSFVDNPNHVHFDVLKISQGELDNAVKAASGGLATITSPSDTDTDSNDSNPADTTNVCCDTGSGDTVAASTSDDIYGKQAYSYLVNTAHFSSGGAAGIVGNMTTESVGVEPERLQGHITEKVPAQTLSTSEQLGYGLVQWTPAGQKILAAAHPLSKANDINFQLNYLVKELNSGYKGVVSQLKKSSISPEDAASVFLNGFEHPADPAATESTRQGYARAYFNLETKGTPLPSSVPTSKPDGKGTATSADTSSDPSTVANCSDPNETSASDAASGNCPVTAPAYGAVKGSGDEYSQAQLTSLFGNPGTESSHPDIDKNLETVDFNGHSVQVHKKAADCLKAVAADIKAANVNYKITEMGCYRFDSNNGSSNIGLRSYHTYGVACDINWDKNPFVSGGATAAHDMPEAYIKAFHDHGFTWGGDWVSVKDYMHFEFNGLKP